MDIALSKKAEIQKLRALVLPSVPAETPQDADVWGAFKNGSRVALNSIFTKYAKLLFSYGRNMTADRALVADCIQDVFVELWSKRQVISNVTSVKFYLIKALRRRIVRRIQTDRRMLVANGNYDEVEFSIEFTIINDQASLELTKHLKLAVAELSRRQQEAIYLKFYEGMSYEDLAQVMEIDMKAAYNLIGRAIVQLRNTLKTQAVAI
jgi:RNA polymerase sigma factor (sigma-70 family)